MNQSLHYTRCIALTVCYALFRCRLSVTDKVALIKTFAPEITTEDELAALLTNKPHPVAYDGFEPSGRMHIAQVSPPCLSPASQNLRRCCGLGSAPFECSIVNA